MRVHVTGRLALSERAGLEASLAGLAPDFGWFEGDLTLLGTEVGGGDLDMIDRGGALREAADALLAQAQDPSLAAVERDLAEAALARLFTLVQGVRA